MTGQVTTVLSDKNADDNIAKLIYGSAKGIEDSLGNPAAATALAAAIQAQEVIKLITDSGEVLHKKLLYFDLQYNIF